MLIQADATQLPYKSKTFHACVTSPPYWGLRKYSGDQGEEPLGLESTPERHIERMIEVFREVRRVLRDDGVCWLNYGDCYANAGSDGTPGKTAKVGNTKSGVQQTINKMGLGHKAGSLMLMPHRLAIALQAPYYLGRIKKEIDRVWLAAMIEAEGCVHIHRRPAGQKAGNYVRTQDSYTPGLEIGNTNPEIVKRCAELSGYVGGTSRQTPQQNKRRDQTIYRWTIRGNQCRNILKEVYPYMVTESKKQQARIALASPSSGDDAKRSWDSLKRLHKGNDATIDFKPPTGKDLWEPGWILRNDNVWRKSNPMPESVAGWRWERSKTKTGKLIDADFRSERSLDHQSEPNPSLKLTGNRIAEYEYGDDYVLRKSSWRHTRAHEYVFQLTKGMGYYCNQEVVRENAEYGYSPTTKGVFAQSVGGQHGSHTVERGDGTGGRNPRSVLDVPTAPYKGAHYATFPPKLIAPLIRASVPRRCCPECGMAWAPVVEKAFVPQTDVSLEKGIKGANNQKPAAPENRWDGTPRGTNENTVTDYRPTCECYPPTDDGKYPNGWFIDNPEWVPKPGIVLDIFGGSGTTGMVAKQLMRRWVVMDISRPYLDEQAKVRTGSGTPANALDGLPMFGGEDET